MSQSRSDRSPFPVEQERIAALAVDVFGGRETAEEWLRGPLAIFGGKTPLEMLGSAAGREAVEQALGRISHGVYL
jgi:putative toxin-antitoxin system antitoxin component (TIGR02293 family)